MKVAVIYPPSDGIMNIPIQQQGFDYLEIETNKMGHHLKIFDLNMKCNGAINYYTVQSEKLWIDYSLFKQNKKVQMYLFGDDDEININLSLIHI